MVTINGTEQNVSGMTFAAYLKTTDFAPNRIAVECNGAIIPKSQYATAIMHEGDSVEIVGFVGGG